MSEQRIAEIRLEFLKGWISQAGMRDLFAAYDALSASPAETGLSVEQTADISDAIAEHCAKFGNARYMDHDGLDGCVRQLVADYDALQQRAQTLEQDRDLQGLRRDQSVAEVMRLSKIVTDLQAAETGRSSETSKGDDNGEN